MSTIDIHPEELFDKLVGGSLSGDERERLQAHLASCELCRFELTVRGDFKVDLSELRPSAPAPSALPLAPKKKLRSKARRRAIVWGLAAAALFIATGALASVVTGQSPWRLIAALANDEAPAASSSVAARVASRPARSAAAAAQQAALGPPPESSVAKVPEVIAEARDESAAPPQPLARASVPQPSAAQLFTSANQARAARDTRRAVELYRLLQQRYPRSPEAELSRVTLATLLLHLGEARAALSAFDAYLSSAKRPLEAEAQVGRALSLRALGLRDQEIGAWRIVAQRNPGTSYERRARERLSALGQP